MHYLSMPPLLWCCCSPKVIIQPAWSFHAHHLSPGCLAPQATLGALALALQGAAALQPLQASVKFGKLLLTAVKQYSGGLQPYRAQLEAAAALTKSFMTKGVLAAVAKL